MKIKKGGNSSAIPMPKLPMPQLKPLPKHKPKPLPKYKPTPLPKGPKQVPNSLKKRLGKPMPDLDKIIKKQESGGYSKTYRK